MIPLLTKMIRTYIKFLLTTRKGKIYALLLIVITSAQFEKIFCHMFIQRILLKQD